MTRFFPDFKKKALTYSYDYKPSRIEGSSAFSGATDFLQPLISIRVHSAKSAGLIIAAFTASTTVLRKVS